MWQLFYKKKKKIHLQTVNEFTVTKLQLPEGDAELGDIMLSFIAVESKLLNPKWAVLS